MSPRALPDIISHIRMCVDSPKVAVTCIRDEDLTALCDAAERAAHSEGAPLSAEDLSHIIADELVKQKNEIDNLGDCESVVLMNQTPCINLRQLAERVLAAIQHGKEVNGTWCHLCNRLHVGGDTGMGPHP